MIIKSITKLAKKIIRFVNQSNNQNLPLIASKIPGIDLKILRTCELVGRNWYRDEPLPVAVFWGFNPWKRELMQTYMPNHKLAFVRGVRGKIFASGLTDYLPPHEKIEFFSWGRSVPRHARLSRRTISFTTL